MTRNILYLIAPFLVLFSFKAKAQYKVEDFRKEGMNDTETIQAAMDFLEKKSHGKLEFDGARTYVINKNIELPRYAVGIVLIEGNGCVLKGKNGIHIFNRIPEDQKEALNKMMNTRFIIQHFTFQEGDKGINLGATYGSKITDCSFLKQKVAAIDIQFGLMTTIENCMATLCDKDNFLLRCGTDWGGNCVNSQSNHSHIKACRVYAKKGANTAYYVEGSNGITLEDIISEGYGGIKKSVYVTNKGNSISHLFTIRNFHMEHTPLEAGIHLDFNGHVTIDGLFFQTADTDFPVIKTTQKSATNTLKNIPYFVKGSIIQNQGHLWGIIWNLEDCHQFFYQKKYWKRKDKNGNWVEGFPKAHFNKD